VLNVRVVLAALSFYAGWASRNSPEKAVTDRTPVADTNWGTRDFQVRDPHGNGLQFYRDL
jgi:hypothetical protein